MSQTIDAGGLIEQGPTESRLYVANWDTLNLEEGVELVDAGTFTITPNDGHLVLADPVLLDGNRTVRFRLSGGLYGVLYRVSHQIETNESPSQTKAQSFGVLIEPR